MSIVAVVQVRMGSERLPGKAMVKVAGQPLLTHLLLRLKKAKRLDRIVVATTRLVEDTAIADLAHSHGVAVYRGSTDDVLERTYEAARAEGATVVVRVTADNPLLDPVVIEQVLLHYLAEESDFDYVTNGGAGSGFAHGMTVEVFSFEALKRAHLEAKLPEEREHVTPYFYHHPDLFRLGSFQYRLTVDTEEDLQLVEKIIEALYPSDPTFSIQEIYALLRRRPEWVHINSHIQQRGV